MMDWLEFEDLFQVGIVVSGRWYLVGQQLIEVWLGSIELPALELAHQRLANGARELFLGDGLLRAARHVRAQHVSVSHHD